MWTADDDKDDSDSDFAEYAAAREAETPTTLPEYHEIPQGLSCSEKLQLALAFIAARRYDLAIVLIDETGVQLRGELLDAE